MDQEEAVLEKFAFSNALCLSGEERVDGHRTVPVLDVCLNPTPVSLFQ